MARSHHFGKRRRVQQPAHAEGESGIRRCDRRHTALFVGEAALEVAIGLSVVE